MENFDFWDREAQNEESPKSSGLPKILLIFLDEVKKLLKVSSFIKFCDMVLPLFGYFSILVQIYLEIRYCLPECRNGSENG